MSLEHAKDLQINEDMVFQHKSWRIQRIGELLLILIVIGALLGLLGGTGPLSLATLDAEDASFQVEYQHFARLLESMTLQFEIRPRATTDDAVRLFISLDYLDTMEIQHITPDPETVYAAADRLIYVFPQLKAGEPTTIRFTLKSTAVGQVTTQVGIEGEQPVEFTQFIYP